MCISTLVGNGTLKTEFLHTRLLAEEVPVFSIRMPFKMPWLSQWSGVVPEGDQLLGGRVCY